MCSAARYGERLHGTHDALAPGHPTLENSPHVHYETDFRSVYAKLLDSWLCGTLCRFSTATSDRRAGHFLE